MTRPPSNTASATSAEVLALLQEICRPLEPVRMTLDAALNRVLRESVCSPEDQPPFDRSSVDGFAIRLDDSATRFQIVDDIRAGDWKPQPLVAGQAVRIATGGALPGENLRVVMKEDARVEGALVSLQGAPAGRNIRFRGEDAKRGQVLLETGLTLRPGALALLASLGRTQPLVSPPPRVLHAVTGNEIVPPEQKPGPGQIRDSNSTLVRAFLEPWGVELRRLRLPEDEARARAGLVDSLSTAGEVDMLLISGGASVGEHDFTLDLISALGYEVLVRKTTTRPGKPLLLGRRGNSIAFGLPGNPLAHFVCLNLYVRTALEGFAGRACAALFRTGWLGSDLLGDGNARETFWPGQCLATDDAPLVMPLRWASSGDLTSLASANALIRVAGGAGRMQAGSPIEFVSTLPPA